jgi:hypothetical protein
VSDVNRRLLEYATSSGEGQVPLWCQVVFWAAFGLLVAWVGFVLLIVIMSIRDPYF